MASEAAPGYIARFEDLSRANLPTVGGKAANLGELVQFGAETAPGFVLTTAAYDTFVAENDLQERILAAAAAADPTDSATVERVSTEIRALFEEGSVPDPVETALVGAYEALVGDRRVAVVARSSATAEDLPEASFAGQQETYLNLRDADALVDAVVHCWASLWTARAMAYRAREAISPEAVSLAVIVQELVDADAAGVLFTADPTTGRRDVVTIDAAWGLGEAVVGGDVTPDALIVEKASGTVRARETAEKRVMASPAGDGTELRPVPGRRRGTPVLNDEQAAELTAIAVDIETGFGAPQDIEWALVDDRFVVLQSRPITGLFPAPTPAPTDGRLHVYAHMGHVQALSDAMPPLVLDVWKSWGETLPEELGASDLPPIVAEAGHRVYEDATLLLRTRLLRDRAVRRIGAVSEPVSVGLADIVARRPEEFAGHRSWRAKARTASRATRTLGPLVLAIVPGMLVTSLRALLGRPFDPEAAKLDTVWESYSPAVRAGADPAARAESVFTGLVTKDLLGEAYPRLGPLFTALAIGGWLRRRFPDAREDVDAVGRGFDQDVVTRINLELGDLADLARESPSVEAALREGATLNDLETVAGSSAFLAAFDEFLAEFGHRATGELDISRPRWREDPSPLLGAVRANLDHDAPGTHRERIAHLATEAEAAAQRLEASVAFGPLGPVRRRLLRHIIRAYRANVWIREYPKHGAAHLFTAWRETFLDAGDLLVERGVLDDVDDVWFLRRDELLAALDGEAIDVDFDARHRAFDRAKALTPPPVLTSEGESVWGVLARADTPAGALVGTGVSAGVVEGVARVVRDPNTETILPGEILVAPSSDPGWTPLFLNAAAMVVEVGGPVSHGALVAREYGLPAVVSVPLATTKIQTGQRIRVDGTRGFVELLDDEAAPPGSVASLTGPASDDDSVQPGAAEA